MKISTETAVHSCLTSTPSEYKSSTNEPQLSFLGGVPAFMFFYNCKTEVKQDNTYDLEALMAKQF